MDRSFKLQKTYLKAFNDLFLYDFIPSEEYRILTTFLRISADLRHIKCYFKLMGNGDEKKALEVRKYLKLHKGVIRHYLAKRINSKYTPEIIFLVDGFDYDYYT